MDAIYLIKNRRNITCFNDKPIEPNILAEILNCGRVTPTGKNEQRWKFVIIKNPFTKTKISKIIPEADYMEKANVLVAIFSKDRKFKLEYASAATETMLIAAQYYNIGASWRATYKEPCSKKIEKLLEAPEHMLLMGIIALGYYDYAASNFRDLPPLSEMITYEKFK